MTAVAAGGGAPAALRYPCLDGLRAVAAAAVVLTHAAFMTGNYAETGAGRFFARLDIGVALFFALSGFLLALPMLRAAAAGVPRPRTAAYLWRRALRVLPVYWLTVAAALLLFPGENGASLGDWLRHLVLGQIYGYGWLREGLTHTWSLSTEVSFYLLLPFLVGGLVRLSGDRWRPGRVLGGLGALMLLGLVWLYWTEADERVTGPLNLWLPAFACWFGVGVGMAVLVATGASWRPVRMAHELGRSPWTCWAIAGALFWITCTPVAGAIGLVQQSGAEAVTRNLLYTGVATFALWPLVFGPQRAGRLRAALSSRPMAYLGEISYGVFLFHLIVLTGFYVVLDRPTFTGDVWSTALVGWVGGALVAAVSYRLLERPLMTRWRGLVPERRRAPAGTGSSAAATAPTATAPST
ncbi:acyltransferase family protein [Pseudonocardia humida]|uniref:acyltransferase family protein n=1 Tax=Pseudonocardia humida TaxID=2800819 RepID=UPI00207D5B2E|nr:acyltransferase [Pseudonocardia humida]